MYVPLELMQLLLHTLFRTANSLRVISSHQVREITCMYLFKIPVASHRCASYEKPFRFRYSPCCRYLIRFYTLSASVFKTLVLLQHNTVKQETYLHERKNKKACQRVRILLSWLILQDCLYLNYCSSLNPLLYYSFTFDFWVY